MAGGSGTRFWPVSRKSKPKQFLPPGGGIPQNTAGLSLLEMTLKRARGFAPPERTLVMASAAHRKFLRNLDIPKRNVVHEPSAKNTAPCLGLAARLIESREPGATMCAVPADQFVAKTGEFRKLVKAGARLANEHEAIVSLGAPPHSPETGFGYIERGERIEDAGRGRGVSRQEVQRKTPARTGQEIRGFRETLLEQRHLHLTGRPPDRRAKGPLTPPERDPGPRSSRVR